MLLNPSPLNTSFYLSFVSLLTTFFLSGLTLLSKNWENKDGHWRNILLLETTVSFVAMIIYFMFITYLNKPNKSLGLITNLRYVDWLVTTPMLLISLCLYLHHRRNKDEDRSGVPISRRPIVWIIFFNIIMLLVGYLGETGRINFYLANGLGFTCLLVLFWFINKKFVSEETRKEFYVFVLLWTMYGIVYYFPVVSKNMSYNLLDILAKSGFAVYLLLQMKN